MLVSPAVDLAQCLETIPSHGLLHSHNPVSFIPGEVQQELRQNGAVLMELLVHSCAGGGGCHHTVCAEPKGWEK